MAFSEEEKQQLTDLVMRALDVAYRDYSDVPVRLSSAILIWEVELTEQSTIEETFNELNYHTLRGQGAAATVGLVEMACKVILSQYGTE